LQKLWVYSNPQPVNFFVSFKFNSIMSLLRCHSYVLKVRSAYKSLSVILCFFVFNAITAQIITKQEVGLLPSFTTINKIGQSEEIYQRVKIKINSIQTYNVLSRMGIDLACGTTKSHEHNHDYITVDLSNNELQAIQKTSIETEVLINDVSAFIADRNRKDLPFAKAALKALKKNSFDKNAGQVMGCTQNSLPVPQNFSFGSMSGYLTYSEILDELDKMKNLYPNLITSKRSAGGTRTTLEGNTIYYVKISDNPNRDEPEAEILYTALHHAREPMSMMSQIYYMWYLLENYDTNQEIKNIVDHTELFFVPCVNPDGYFFNEILRPEGGGLWRKNRRDNGNGTYGVDINRNYGFQWAAPNGGSSNVTNASTYHGPSAFSEIESQIMRDFASERNFVNALHNHSYGNLLLHPNGYSNLPSAHDELYHEMSEQMSWHSKYHYGSTSNVLYFTAGEASDWFYYDQGVMSWIPEIGSPENGFWPTPSNIVPFSQSHIHTSLNAALMASNYGIIHDLTPYGIESNSFQLTFDVQHISNNHGNFTVSVNSSSPFVENIGPSQSTGILSGTQSSVVHIPINLSPSSRPGDDIEFTVTLNNGDYDIYTTNIIKKYNPDVLFNDEASDLSNWQSNGWDLSIENGYQSASSITDSPIANSELGIATIQTNSPIDLSDATNPVLEYYAKWDVLRTFDYAQIQISTDGSFWTAVCAEDTKIGGVNSYSITSPQPSEAIYDGLQKSWVRQEVDLSAYTGVSNLYVRFFMNTTSGASKDGFYVDNIRVYQDPLLLCNVGSPCDDGDICTVNDVYDGSCNCSGDFEDSDDDGVCNAFDICPNGDDALDEDGDGIPDFCDDCDGTLTGTSCNDEDACTINDVYDADCNCEGVFADADNDGICDVDDICSNGDDTLDSDGDGTPDYCDDCDGNLVGQSCDDGDACTTNDIYRENCNCEGVFTDADDDTICDADDVCPEGDDTLDVDGDGIPDFCDECDDTLIGTSCDDGDACTNNDTYRANCNCEGVFTDSDNDTICDANDVCPEGDDTLDIDGDGIPDFCDACDDTLIGTSCDDGDVCTENDVIDASCNCIGVFTDLDEDGVCASEDSNDNDACVPNAGSNCATSGATDCSDFNTSRFESGYGIWNSGGMDAARMNDGTSINLYSIRLRDNSGINSSIFTNPLNFSNAENLEFEFSYFPSSMEFSENFIVEISTNGGLDFIVLKDLVSGTDFQNDQWYNETISVDNISLSSTVIFKITCDASSNSDQVYLDNIIIRECGIGSGSSACNIGTPCDDGDACTINDSFDSNCNCIGNYIDNDADGLCFANDPNDQDACIPNASSACATSSNLNCTDLNFNDFEQSIGMWKLGGNDAYYGLDFGTSDDNKMLRIRDNSGIASSVFTELINFGFSNSASLDFSFKGESMEFSEKFHIEVSQNGGSTFSVVQTFISGADFNNDVWNPVSIDLPSVNDATVIRFRCDASSNSDMVFIDNILISACTSGDQQCQMGMPCDDADNCTVNDAYDALCNCIGTQAVDNDMDGFCANEDPDDNNPCNPDPSYGGCQSDLFCNSLSFADFENNVVIWHDGGDDVSISNETSYSGANSIKIRDNSGGASSIFTDALPLAYVSTVNISFFYKGESMEYSEDFLLELSNDGGNTFMTIQSWIAGTDFQNGGWNNAYVSINNSVLTNQSIFRIRCDASSNSDAVFIDDIQIEICQTGGGIPLQAVTTRDNDEKTPELENQSITVFPNPAIDFALIEVCESDSSLCDSVREAKIDIYSITGTRVLSITKEIKSQIELDLRLLEGDQLYFIQLILDGQKANPIKLYKSN